MAHSSPRPPFEPRRGGVFRTVAVALVAAAVIGLVALDLYAIHLREERQHVFVQLFNLDDEATVRVNGTAVLRAGHGDERTRDLGWLANSDRIETRFVNRGGTYTWGARVSSADGELDLDAAGIIDAIGADGNASPGSDRPVVVHCRRVLADGTGGRDTCDRDDFLGNEVTPSAFPPVPDADDPRDRLVAATVPLTALLLFGAVLAAVWAVGRRFNHCFFKVVEWGLALFALASAIVGVTNAFFGV